MRTKNNTNMVLCPKCGGEYDTSLAKCPYCGYIHEKGAERKFLNDLEQKRQELDKVDDQARKDYLNEWKRDGKSVLRRILIVAAVLIVLVIAVLIIHKLGDAGEDRDYAREMVWQHEHFPEFDRLYEEGKWQELQDLLFQYGAEGHDVWEWAHYEEIRDMDREESP